MIMFLLSIDHYVVYGIQIKPLLDLQENIEPGVTKMKITRQNADAKGPNVLKVLRNHTRSSDYMIQFSRDPRLRIVIVRLVN